MEITCKNISERHRHVNATVVISSLTTDTQIEKDVAEFRDFLLQQRQLQKEVYMQPGCQAVIIFSEGDSDIVLDYTEQKQPCSNCASAKIQECAICRLEKCIDAECPSRARVVRFMLDYETWSQYEDCGELNTTALTEETADELNLYEDDEDYKIPEDIFEIAHNVEQFLEEAKCL